MTQDELINQMADALQTAMEVQDKYAAALDEMDKENKFLSETIVNNELGLIAEERRKLLSMVSEAESSANQSIAEANTIKSEYSQKLDKITILIKDVKSKQDSIDSYIDSESDAKITDIKKTLNAKYKQKHSELENEYQQKESACEAKVSKYKQIMIATIIGMVIAMGSALTGIKALLLLIAVELIISIWLNFRKRG